MITSVSHETTGAKEKQQYCTGCANDFYNGNNSIGVTECWSLKTASVATRYRLSWWTRPDEPGAFQRVTTLTCHHAPGRYAHYETLPTFAREARQ